MNGPEHYREAESLLDNAADAEGGSNSEHYYLAAAQVHATLALAAATVDRDGVGYDTTAWNEAIR